MKAIFSMAWRMVFAVLALTLIAGCSTTPDNIEVTESTIVLDVRTPGEFAAGHLAGAELLDFNSGELEDSLGELDPDAEYLVYCRSGNRSAQAVALMEDAGFTNVTDLGSMEAAGKATGLEIVVD